MIKKALLALIGIIIVGDLIIMGISFSNGSSNKTNSTNGHSDIYISNDSKISPVDVRTILDNKAQGGIVKSLNFNPSKDEYTAVVENLNNTYKATVNGNTGTITTFVNENIKPKIDLDFTPISSNDNGANFITASQAVKAFEKAVPNGTINQLTYNIVATNPQYDANIIKGNDIYHVSLDAFSGRVISNYKEPLTSNS